MAWGWVLALPLEFPCLRRFLLTMHNSGEVDSRKQHLADCRRMWKEPRLWFPCRVGSESGVYHVGHLFRSPPVCFLICPAHVRVLNYKSPRVTSTLRVYFKSIVAHTCTASPLASVMCSKNFCPFIYLFLVTLSRNHGNKKTVAKHLKLLKDGSL